MPNRRAVLAALASALLAFAVIGCGGSPSAAPSSATPTPPAASPANPTDVPGGPTPPPGPGPGTFETAWGEAWDALPPGFPVPADARPAEPGDPTLGPVSATFTIGQPPEQVAGEVQAALATAGYSTEALSGPYEDGSLVVDSVGLEAACRVQTTIRPLSGVVMMTVLYGAACPWE
jgi:hypothetical protein